MSLLLAAALLSHAAAFASDVPHDVVSPAPTDAETRLAEAQAAFDAMQTEDAEKKLETLVSDSSAPESVRAKAWLTLGLARASLLDDDGARVAFAAALAIDGSLAPPQDSSPKVKALFARIKSRLPAGGGVPVEKPIADPVKPDATPSTTATNATTTSTTSTTSATTTTPVTARTPPDATFATVTIVGAAALAGAAALGGGAFAADSALATPEPGRSRDQYETIRALGIASAVGAGICAVGGAVALAIGIGGMS